MKNYKTIGGLLLALVAAYFGWDTVTDSGNTASDSAAPTTIEPARGADSRDRSEAPVSDNDYRDAADRIVDAFEAGQGDLWIEAGGRVSRVLSDDNEGSRHQRFIVRLANDHTILIAHNIDLAQRVPLKMGDAVSFYGEYEWNERGGVIHWTHHDPRGRRDGGWIRHKNTTYR
ncbi:MAG: DUF3465 domain-containing protein [Gammaproteobacteria bacterium]|nr:DUF3465 domain-containing protein [Gammaproteobacteria bacterium]NND61026.1 DUF3465 domain-containing protein [Gammaproteobacteria bacterium]